jgi:hypothetical protein
MQLVVDHTGRFRPIIYVPWILGELQGERLPINLYHQTSSGPLTSEISAVVS